MVLGSLNPNQISLKHSSQQTTLRRNLYFVRSTSKEFTDSHNLYFPQSLWPMTQTIDTRKFLRKFFQAFFDKVHEGDINILLIYIM